MPGPVSRVAALLGAAYMSATAAHHSFPATYDMFATAEVEGEIASLEWRNPHVVIDVRTREGVHWRVEADPIGALERAGLSRRRLNAGRHVRVAGYPARDGGAALYASHVLLDGRREYLVRPAVPPRWTGVDD